MLSELDCMSCTFVWGHLCPCMCTQKPDVDIITLLLVVETCSLTELDSLARLAREHPESTYLPLTALARGTDTLGHA